MISLPETFVNWAGELLRASCANGPRIVSAPTDSLHLPEERLFASSEANPAIAFSFSSNPDDCMSSRISRACAILLARIRQ